MKNTIKLILFILLFYCKSQAQQLVESTKDLYRLEQSEEQFIDKPLKDLLKEIRPEIKTVFVMRGNNFFCFKFLPLEQLKKEEGSYEDRVSLYVHIKGDLNWNWEERPIGRETVWTKEDAEKYGDLIVAHIELFYK